MARTHTVHVWYTVSANITETPPSESPFSSNEICSSGVSLSVCLATVPFPSSRDTSEF